MKPAGANVDVPIGRSLHSHGKTRIEQLTKSQQRQLVNDVIFEIMSTSTSGPSMSMPSRVRWMEIVQLLDTREAWIYRDWQAAIGDLLLVSASEGSRTYDAIGYREFEELYINGNEEPKK
ncbi:MAG: hypothetical protein KF680_03570 [Cryobacterium sp.]|nr:hypothetical protein [Cryobacterium sp.]